jgi:CRP-like cAMP-binding protein
MPQLLSNEERARLAVIASIVRFEKGAEIHREGEPARAVFNIINGVVKAYTHGPGRNELIGSFLFHEDLFGLAQEGSHVSSVRAVTPVTAYRIPVASLRKQFSTDAALEFHVIAELRHELRQVQRHAFVLASKHNGFEADAVPPDVGASSSRQRRADQRDIPAHGPLRHLRICRHFAFGRQQGVPSPYGPRDPESPEPTTRKGHRPLRLRGDHPRRRNVATGKGAIRRTAHR